MALLSGPPKKKTRWRTGQRRAVLKINTLDKISENQSGTSLYLPDMPISLCIFIAALKGSILIFKTALL
jgi:hypothetical protein